MFLTSSHSPSVILCWFGFRKTKNTVRKNKNNWKQENSRHFKESVPTMSWFTYLFSSFIYIQVTATLGGA